MKAADSAASPVLTETSENVGYLTLNRPNTLNAFNLDLAESFIRAVEQFAEDGNVRAVVIRGAGRVFSAGGDVREMLDNVRRGDPAAYFREPLVAFHRMVLAVRGIGKPVLAAAHGAAAGVAFNLLLACDLRLAAAGTIFTQAFVKLGLSPDGGGTFILPRLIGHARACELIMLPTQLDAPTALSWGLLNRVVPVESFAEQTRQIAAQLAAGPTAALARAKAMLNETEGDALVGHLEKERLAQVDNAATADFAEGLTAFTEKRKPLFRGR